LFRGTLSRKLGNVDDAVASLEKVHRLWGLSPTIINLHLGDAYLAADRYEDAIHTYRQVLKCFDADSPISVASRRVKAHYQLGVAYEAVGQHNEAIEQYELFLDIWKSADPGIDEVEDALIRLSRLKRES
jgi:tetratricopeptide (TPR) repeat protein